MDRSSSAENHVTPPALDPAAADTLLRLGDAAVRAGLDGHPPPGVDTAELPAALTRPAGAFVTLLVDDELNGCIGTLEPEPLGPAVARLAWDSAFADPRLPRLRWEDYEELTLKVSVLSELEPLDAASEEELLAGLRPGTDGLLLSAGGRRATFLPAVWEPLPDPVDFVRHLQAKAGLAPGVWQRGTQAWRYTAEEIGRRVRDLHPVGR